jgi:hypothetical protein
MNPLFFNPVLQQRTPKNKKINHESEIIESRSVESSSPEKNEIDPDFLLNII